MIGKGTPIESIFITENGVVIKDKLNEAVEKRSDQFRGLENYNRDFTSFWK